MWYSPINRSAELTQGALQLILTVRSEVFIPYDLLLHDPDFLADWAGEGLLVQNLAQVQHLVLAHALLLTEVLELALVSNRRQESLSACNKEENKIINTEKFYKRNLRKSANQYDIVWTSGQWGLAIVSRYYIARFVITVSIPLVVAEFNKMK